MVCKSHLWQKRDAGFDIIWFGVLSWMNMHFANLSLRLAPSAFSLKTAALPPITLEQICFSGNPYLAITVLALILPLIFPELSLWLAAQVV